MTNDEHGDFKYTLRQFLLMRRLSMGGEWPDVHRDVLHQLGGHPDWDPDATNTYADWRTWYYSDAVA